jgi:hypothetical protein
MLSAVEGDFENLMKASLDLICNNDATTDEVYTYLRYYPCPTAPDKLVGNASFQATLKTMGFKWK